MATGNPTACLLVIGNEVLSGRTQDANIRFLAVKLGELGIPLREVRVIPDVPETIIRTVNEDAGDVRLRVHHRRHRPDARRHHQRMRRRRVRRAMGAASRGVGAHGAQLQAGRIQRRAPAHGDDAAGREPDRQRAVGGAGVSDRQRLCDGGCAAGDAVDVRVAGAAAARRPEDRAARGVRGGPAGGRDRRRPRRDPGTLSAARSRQLSVLPARAATAWRWWRRARMWPRPRRRSPR